MNKKTFLTETNSLKPVFAARFLKALYRIKHHQSISSSSAISSTSRRIKLAADASMASAVGSRRAWSRAVLHRARSRAGILITLNRRRPSIAAKKVKMAMKKSIKNNNNNKNKKQLVRQSGTSVSCADRLRCVVPGGASMNFCSLLDETAHYIKCLSAQVQVMQNIVDTFSS